MKKQRSFKEEMEDVRTEITSGSIYEELGYDNPSEAGTKSNLISEMGKIIKKRKLTQSKAAAILGITQPKLSALLRGHFRGYSVERLLVFLNELGTDVDIVLKTKPTNRNARINVYSNLEIGVPVPLAPKSSNTRSSPR